MKKLLSILAVSGIISTSSPITIACSEKTTNGLKTLDMTKIHINLNDNLYRVVRTAIADQSNDLLNVYDIQHSSTILESIFDSEGNLLADGEKAFTENYDIKIFIDNTNTVFNPMDWTTKTITVSKIDFDIDQFKTDLDATFTSGTNAYNAVRAAIALQSNDILTAADIKNDKITILEAIWDSQGNAIADPTILTSQTYDIKILIINNSGVFNELDWTIISINVL